MKILIIEDEEPAARRLKKMLQEIDGRIDVLQVIDSVEESVNWLNGHSHPDLILMDIMLADGQSFEIFRSVKLRVPVIFTTAYDAFAIRAFEVNSVDYLLKPIQMDLLERALNKFQSLYLGNEKLERLVASLIIRDRHSAHPASFRSRFLVKSGSKFLPISVQEIAWFRYSDKITFLHLSAAKRYMVDYALDELEQIVDPFQFFRLNRQYLVSFNSIKTIHSDFNGRLLIFLKDEEEGVLVSRERAVVLKDWLNR